MNERKVQELTLWFRKEAEGEVRLRELLEDGWVGCMRNDGPIWKIRVVRPSHEDSPKDTTQSQDD